MEAPRGRGDRRLCLHSVATCLGARCGSSLTLVSLEAPSAQSRDTSTLCRVQVAWNGEQLSVTESSLCPLLFFLCVQ